MKESRAAKKPAAAKKAETNVPQIPESELPADGGVRIALPGFEGPLDLLLHLIQEHELDILNIPIAFVTKKYLEYMDLMQSMNIDIASEYLVMAATLAHIKSRMLLPTPPADLEEGDEEELDPRAELIKRLLEYQKYKRASEELASRSVLGRDIFVRPPQPALDPSTAPLAPVGSFKLLEAFQRILSRTKIVVDHQVEFERFSLSDRINQLVDFLKGKGRVDFEALFEGQMSRADLIVTFLALLELTRLRMTRIYQEGSLTPITIEMVGDSDELNANGELRLEGEEAAPKPPPPPEEPTRLPPLPADERDILPEEEEEFDAAKILAEAAAEEAEERRLARERKLAEAAALAEAEVGGKAIAVTSLDENAVTEPSGDVPASDDAEPTDPAVAETTPIDEDEVVSVEQDLQTAEELWVAPIDDDAATVDSDNISATNEFDDSNDLERHFVAEMSDEIAAERINVDANSIEAAISVVSSECVTVPEVPEVILADEGVMLSAAEAIAEEGEGRDLAFVEETIVVEVAPESTNLEDAVVEMTFEATVDAAMTLPMEPVDATEILNVEGADEGITLSAAAAIADEVRSEACDDSVETTEEDRSSVEPEPV